MMRARNLGMTIINLLSSVPLQSNRATNKLVSLYLVARCNDVSCETKFLWRSWITS